MGAEIRTHRGLQTGPLLLKRMSDASALMSRGGGVRSTMEDRATAVAVMVNTAGLHALEVAHLHPKDLRKHETKVMKVIWGSTRPCRAKEVVFSFFVPGHRVAPTMVCSYLRMCWLARLCRARGPVMLAAQAVWETGDKGVNGPFGRALQAYSDVGWTPIEGWWKWKIRGVRGIINLATSQWRALKDQFRDSIRSKCIGELEVRRPRLFKGISCAANHRFLPRAISSMA